MQILRIDTTVNLLLIWSIISFFIGLLLGIFIDELKQLYKDRGRIILTGKKIDLIFENFDHNGQVTSVMNGSPMLYKAKVHLYYYNNSRRTRTIRNLKLVGKVKNGGHFTIDLSQGKMPPSFVVNQKEIKEISLLGECVPFTSFMPFFPDLLTLELVYENDNRDVKYVQFKDSEMIIIDEATFKQWETHS
jgi:hypothetical protein